MISNDLRRRAVVLTFIYGIPLGLISDILGVSPSSIKRWTVLFKKTGHVGNEKERAMHSRYPPEVLALIGDYAKENPCFYIEEFQTALRARFSTLRNTSIPTLCRALKFDLKFWKKY
jgi:transposase-like protein